jgi:hypothetical protein
MFTVYHNILPNSLYHDVTLLESQHLVFHQSSKTYINKSKGMHTVYELYYIALIYDLEVSLKEKKLLVVQEHPNSPFVLGGVYFVRS